MSDSNRYLVVWYQGDHDDGLIMCGDCLDDENRARQAKPPHKRRDRSVYDADSDLRCESCGAFAVEVM